MKIGRHQRKYHDSICVKCLEANLYRKKNQSWPKRKEEEHFFPHRNSIYLQIIKIFQNEDNCDRTVQLFKYAKTKNMKQKPPRLCVCVCVKHLLLQRSGGEMCGDTGRIGSPPCGVLGSITLRSLGLGINLALGVVMVSQFGSTGFGSKHPYGSSVPLSSDFPKHYKYMVGRHTYRKSIHTHKVSG